MTATGTIRRPSGAAATFDPMSGRSTDAPPTIVYSGPIRVQDELSKRVNQVEFGDQQVTISRVRLSLPLGSNALPGDRVTVDTCPSNPAMVGDLLRIMQEEQSSIAWQQEFTCERGSV